MPKILIIDDEIDTCKLLTIFFEGKGYEAIYSLTGRGGLDAFYKENPSVVITDLSLGDISGFEVLKEIKNKRPSCGVILITASGAENMTKAMSLGADYFLSKPFSLFALSALVKKLI